MRSRVDHRVHRLPRNVHKEIFSMSTLLINFRQFGRTSVFKLDKSLRVGAPVFVLLYVGTCFPKKKKKRRKKCESLLLLLCFVIIYMRVEDVMEIIDRSEDKSRSYAPFLFARFLNNRTRVCLCNDSSLSSHNS